MKIKMIAVKRHTSVPCIPLTPQFVTSVIKSWSKLDTIIDEIAVKGEDGKITMRPNVTENVDVAKAIITAYNTLSAIVEAFESECEPEQN